MLKLKLQCFGHLIQRADSLEKTLMLGKIEGKRRGWQRMRQLEGIIVSINGHEFEQTLEMVKDREAWRASVHKVAKSQTRLSSWTMTTAVFSLVWDNYNWVSPPALYDYLIAIYKLHKKKNSASFCHLFPGTSKAFEQSKYLRNNWNKMLVSSYLCLNFHTYNQIIAWPGGATQLHITASHSFHKAFHLEIIFKYKVSSKHVFELSKQVMLCTQYRI